MSTEKTIRNQAKKLLEGNWLMVTASIIALFTTVILVQSLAYIAMFVFGVFDLDTFEPIKSREWIAGISFLGMLVLLFFLSPMLNGLYKIFCSIALYGKGGADDLFFFFRNKRYYKTLRLNFAVLGVFFAFCAIFNVYGYVSYFAQTILQDNSSFDIIINILLVLSQIVTAAAMIFAYFIFVHYSLIAYSFNDSKRVADYTVGMYSFSLANLGATIKMIPAFIGWAALCFFVVPAFYVLPYFMMSMTVSAKWLFALGKERGLLC